MDKASDYGRPLVRAFNINLEILGSIPRSDIGEQGRAAWKHAERLTFFSRGGAHVCDMGASAGLPRSAPRRRLDCSAAPSTAACTSVTVIVGGTTVIGLSAPPPHAAHLRAALARKNKFAVPTRRCSSARRNNTREPAPRRRRANKLV